MKRSPRSLGAALLVGLVAASTVGGCSCSEAADPEAKAVTVPGSPVAAIPGHETLIDDSVKEGPRLMPAETYLRTYLHFFGDVTPLELEAVARGDDQGAVFDRWSDYLGSLGFPDQKLDVQRQKHTNTLMIATFERLAIALCVRRAEVELAYENAPPISERRVYAFDLTAKEPSDSEFAERFDVLHRTFLGYPAALAEVRVARYLEVYRDVVTRHSVPGTSSRFTPQQSGWAAVCYGLARHPEFHLY